MKWYAGDIGEAIVFSKSKGAVFVVYIEGTDDLSQKITSLINNGEVGHKLEQDNFVAIKICAGSLAHHQFSEIYKGPSVPSIYFIGKNGVPLEIINENSNLDELSLKIDEVLTKAGFNAPIVDTISASVLSDNFIKHEQSSSSPRVVCDNNVMKIVEDQPTESDKSQSEPVAETSNDNNEESKDVQPVVDTELSTEENIEKAKEPEVTTELSAYEKVQRAKELIELKRQQKEKEEQENERQKELERRKMGQSVQQMKKWQEDQELKQLKEDRDREKRENQIARDRVLAQIAQDRAERQSRSQSNSPPKVVEPVKATTPPPKLDSNVTKLQFKMPDGSSVLQEFDISDTLDNVVGFLKNSVTISFTLATTFPRKEFTTKDYQTTLLDLGLVPNAVVLVLPINNGTVATHTNGGFISSLIWGMLTPIFSIFGYIKSLVFGPPSSTGRRNTRPPPNEPAETSGSSKRKSNTGEPSSVIRRQGNIHRLQDRNDSDDENKTWNGNSTQQM